MKKKHRFLQIGLGSMGKRRVRNLLYHKVNCKDIAGFDPSLERCQEAYTKYNIKTFTNYLEALNAFNPTEIIISTPPNKHSDYFLDAVKRKINFFVEVSTVDEGYLEVISSLKKLSVIGVPSCTYRFFDPIMKMHSIISQGLIGEVQAFIHHCGQYLPDWHPWESYKNFYVSKPETSALKEMFVYELSWIQWVINKKLINVSGTSQKVTDLEMDIPDIYAAYLTDNGTVLGTIFIDLVARFPFRTIRILGSEGTIEWNLLKKTIEINSIKNKKIQVIKFNKLKKLKGYSMADETMYENEIGAFIDAVDGKSKYPYSFEDDNDLFKLLHKFEKNTCL